MRSYFFGLLCALRLLLGSANTLTCERMAAWPCVFIVSFGRTGSTHILKILNSIKGYRLTGETRDAWIYLGWYANGRKDPQFTPNGTRTSHNNTQPMKVNVDVGVPGMVGNSSICAMRQLMLLLHNPLPRSRYAMEWATTKPSLIAMPRRVKLNALLTQGIRVQRNLLPIRKAS